MDAWWGLERFRRCSGRLLHSLTLALVLTTGSTYAAEQAPPDVTIDPGGVPPAVLQAVASSVDKIAALSLDQDGGEIERLRRRAKDVTLTALATEGYFMPTVTLAANRDELGETWDITIEPGERAVIRQLNLIFEGAIAGESYAERRKALQEAWQLPVGAPFRNAVWESSKRELLSAVTDVDFALARMVESQARVDPESASVDLSVTIASGPRILLGALDVDGLARVPASLIARYVRYETGVTAYDRRQLVAWQQELQRTVFFSAVELELQTAAAVRELDSGPQGGAAPSLEGESGTQSPANPSRYARFFSQDEAIVPLGVTVIEAPPHRLAFSLGVDSDVGPKVEAMYRQNVVAGRAVEMQAGLGVHRKEQRAFLDFYLPPDPDGFQDKFGALLAHQDIQGQDVRRGAVGWVRNRTHAAGNGSRVVYETALGLLGSYERVRYADTAYSLPSAVATYEWVRRDVDNKYNPRQGNLVALGGGLGSALNGWDPFSRLQARGQVWWPIGSRDVFIVRGEVGKVWSQPSANIPSDFGFRTGGARTIRGYQYLSIGKEVNGAVIGTNALAIASMEYQHFFTDVLGIGVFVDAGDAASTFRDMDIAVGTGAGLRVRTPAGPIYIDLAYAVRDRRLRLNFSLGIAF